jgi:uncharacterized surface protein with fasciclin (FAS1) repeats
VQPSSAPRAPPTITEFIEGEPDLSILFNALQRVSGFDVDFRPIFNGRRNLLFQKNNTFRTNDLFNILDEPGDYTFFAPTNNAFRLLPSELLEILFFDDDFLPHLEDLLLYHGLVGERFISQFGNENIATFNIEPVRVRRRPNGILSVNAITVGDSNNDASNGVTHKLSGVLTPAWLRNSVLDFTNTTTGDLSILYELLLLSGLDQVLNILGSGVTLLAPTNDAFNDLDGDTDLSFLRDPANRVELDRILRYHVVDGVFTSPRLTNGSNIPTEFGSITVSVVDQIIMFNQATATSESILASNGVLYEISAVLNPDTGAGF